MYLTLGFSDYLLLVTENLTLGPVTENPAFLYGMSPGYRSRWVMRGY